MPEPEGIGVQKRKKGMNNTTEQYTQRKLGLDSHRVEIVKGYYEESLPEFSFSRGERIALAYID
jgi:hypothetical protein